MRTLSTKPPGSSSRSESARRSPWSVLRSTPAFSATSARVCSSPSAMVGIIWSRRASWETASSAMMPPASVVQCKRLPGDPVVGVDQLSRLDRPQVSSKGEQPADEHIHAADLEPAPVGMALDRCAEPSRCLGGAGVVAHGDDGAQLSAVTQRPRLAGPGVLAEPEVTRDLE